MSGIESVYRKIEWAEQHVGNLDRAVRRFCNSDPYVIGAKPHRISEIDHTTLFVHSFQEVPCEIALIVGDIVHNLRSALDHLAWQLVVANGKVPGMHTYFPICDPTKQFTTSTQGGKVKGMGACAKQIIRSIQPNNTGDHTLWFIHELDRSDKHRFLITAALASTAFGLTPFGLTPPYWYRDSRPFLLVNGDDFVSIPTATYLQYAHENFKLALDIAFGQSEVTAGKPVLETLHQMVHFIRNLVSLFEPCLS